MSKKVKKKKQKIKYFSASLGIILLLIATIYLYQENTSQEKNLNKLESKLEIRKQQEEFVSKHQEDLTTIKTLKQEILGQQHKLEEFNKQISSFTETLIKNQEKLDKLES